MEIVLNTFGTSLNRDNEGFVVTNKDGRQRLPLIGIKSIQVGKGVQAAYDNEDSILVVPISTDYLRAMKISKSLHQNNTFCIRCRKQFFSLLFAS